MHINRIFFGVGLVSCSSWAVAGGTLCSTECSDTTGVRKNVCITSAEECLDSCMIDPNGVSSFIPCAGGGTLVDCLWDPDRNDSDSPEDTYD